jgi:6-phosphogluconate dehydrogenase
MKIAVHGLGRMGMQIARKLAESGQHHVIAHNRSREPIDEAVTYGCSAAVTKADVLGQFGQEPTVIWVMLPADVAEEHILEWAEIAPTGSVIVSGGNSDYRTTRELGAKVAAAGKRMVDIGVSGGVWGYDNGFPLMCGADDTTAFDALKPALDTLVQPGGSYHLFGPSGAGHYVKMVHNAIEYGMMQSLGEGYRLLHEGPYDGIDLAAAGDLWQHHSVVTSWLNQLSADALRENPTLDGVSGYVAESGEARWALETAEQQGFTLPCIQTSFDVRVRSQQGETNFATKVVAAQRNKFGGHNLNGEGAA